MRQGIQPTKSAEMLVMLPFLEMLLRLRPTTPTFTLHPNSPESASEWQGTVSDPVRKIMAITIKSGFRQPAGGEADRGEKITGQALRHQTSIVRSHRLEPRDSLRARPRRQLGSYAAAPNSESHERGGAPEMERATLATESSPSSTGRTCCHRSSDER